MSHPGDKTRRDLKFVKDHCFQQICFLFKCHRYQNHVWLISFAMLYFLLWGWLATEKIILGHSLLVLLSCTLWITLLECCHIEMLSALSKTNTFGTGTKGAFHSNQNSRNFVWYIKWNRPFWFGVQPEYSGMNIVVHFDRSGHFGRLDRNVPFHLTKFCPQYRSFLACLQEQ